MTLIKPFPKGRFTLERLRIATNKACRSLKIHLSHRLARVTLSEPSSDVGESNLHPRRAYRIR
jgi:hypothetical protein